MLILSNIARLYDGTAGTRAAVHLGVDLFIDGSRIRDRKPHDSNLRVGDEHTVVDLTGMTVMPGLVDATGT